MTIYKYVRWALKAHGFLLGGYCWTDTDIDDTSKRTFKTRELARAAKKDLTSYRDCAKPVKVHVIIKEV